MSTRLKICASALILSSFFAVSCAKKGNVNEKTEEVPVPKPVPVPVVPKVSVDITEPTQMLYVNKGDGRDDKDKSLNMYTANGDGGLGLEFDSNDSLKLYAGIPVSIKWENIKEASQIVTLTAAGDSDCQKSVFTLDKDSKFIRIDATKVNDLSECSVTLTANGSYNDKIVSDVKTINVNLVPTFAEYADSDNKTVKYLKAIWKMTDNSAIVRKIKSMRASGLDLKYMGQDSNERELFENANALIGAQSIENIDASNTALKDLHALVFLKNLHALNLSNTYIEAKDIIFLKDAQSLESLNISNLHMKDLSSVTDNLANLTELNISDNDQIRTLKDIKQLKKLTVLHASNVGLTNFDDFENMMQIKTLDISKNKFSLVEKKDVAKLDNLYALESFNVSQAQISDDLLNAYFLDMASHNTLKQFIDEGFFNKNEPVTKQDCALNTNNFDFIPNLGHVPSLEFVDISGNACIVKDSDTTTHHVGMTTTKLVSTLTHLTYLDISNTLVNNVGDLANLQNTLSSLELHLVRKNADGSVDNASKIDMIQETCMTQLGTQFPRFADECKNLGTGNQKSKEFTTSGSFSVPDNVYSIQITGCSAGDGGQGGQNGRGGFSGSMFPQPGLCWTALDRPNCSGALCKIYYCENPRPGQPATGVPGSKTTLTDDAAFTLFDAGQDTDTENTGVNGYCIGGQGGQGGKAGAVNTGDWVIPRPSEPQDGLSGVAGPSKKVVEKTIAVRPGAILHVTVGIGGSATSPINDEWRQNAGCGWPDAGNASSV